MTLKDQLDALELPAETRGYVKESLGGTEVLFERRHDMLDPEARVYINRMTADIPGSVAEALAKVGFTGRVGDGTPVAIKVNIGGGVAGVPSSFTDPLVVEGVIDAVREAGGDPFVCEANMRSMTMTTGMLARRALYPLLVRKGVRFVNLSDLRSVDFFPLGWKQPISLPHALLSPEVVVISVPALKHHWECGITLAAKNMYGAIAERQKSLFHRGGAIDETVAAAARATEPDFSVLAHRQVGGGLGPHFCIPVDFGYVVASDSFMAADRVGCDFMGADWRRIKHLQINCGGREIPYRTVEGSVPIDPMTRQRVARTAIGPLRKWLWRALLYPQYYVPHGTQFRQIPKIETLGSLLNWWFCHPRGDPWPVRWRPR
ncbi:MAG: DUF362 domain-containing protein [Actinomycetota bacterium]